MAVKRGFDIVTVSIYTEKPRNCLGLHHHTLGCIITLCKVSFRFLIYNSLIHEVITYYNNKFTPPYYAVPTIITLDRAAF